MTGTSNNGFGVRRTTATIRCPTCGLNLSKTTRTISDLPLTDKILRTRVCPNSHSFTTTETLDA